MTASSLQCPKCQHFATWSYNNIGNCHDCKHQWVRLDKNNNEEIIETLRNSIKNLKEINKENRHIMLEVEIEMLEEVVLQIGDE